MSKVGKTPELRYWPDPKRQAPERMALPSSSVATQGKPPLVYKPKGSPAKLPISSLLTTAENAKRPNVPLENNRTGSLLQRAVSGTSVSKPEPTPSTPHPALQPAETPRFIIVDAFGKRSLDLNGDGQPDISHGEAVSAQVTSRIPQATLERVDTGLGNLSPAAQRLFEAALDPAVQKNAFTRMLAKVTATDLTDKLNGIADQARRGLPVEGVNMSLSPRPEDTSIQDFERWAGMPLTLENQPKLKAKLAALAQTVKAPQAKVSDYEYQLGHYYQVTQALENLAQQGVPVYIAAGNEGPDSFSVYSLAKRVTTVGEKDFEEIVPWSPNNPFVDIYARGFYNAEPIEDEKSGRLVGYDLTGDQKPDTLAEAVSNHGQFFPRDKAKTGSTRLPLYGTSFASPTAMAEDWLRRQQEKTELGDKKTMIP